MTREQKDWATGREGHKVRNSCILRGAEGDKNYWHTSAGEPIFLVPALRATVAPLIDNNDCRSRASLVCTKTCIQIHSVRVCLSEFI